MATTFLIGAGLQRYIAYEQEQLRLQAQANNANAVNTLVRAKGTPNLPAYPFHSTTDSLLAAQLYGGITELRLLNGGDFQNGENANFDEYSRVTLIAQCRAAPPELQYFVLVGFDDTPPSIVSSDHFQNFGFPLTFNVPFVIAGRENVARLCFAMSNQTRVYALCEK